MKVIVTLILLSILAVISGCSSGGGSFLAGYDFSSIDKIAVVEVTGYFKKEGVRNQIANFVEIELLERGFAPIERSRIQALIDEQDFQASEITATDAVKTGKILNVPAILLIDVPEFGENINVSGKMLDATDGRILWVGYGKARTGKLLTTVIAATAGAVIGAAVDSDHTTEGAIIGGVLGGAAGYTLSPQAAEKVKEAIGKMCDSMPSRLK
ncbi:MAG: glycine zipper 2TM domain-containing protein [Planctomycetes bacterium]|nr:glycine zipper 2TM domain-containing protein [Planctomycetota bacterium]